MKKIFKSVIFLFLAGMMSVNVNAQVNIGTDKDPLPGALLQLREDDEATGAANASKGLAFPRVKLSHAGELYPMFLENPKQDYNETSNPASGDYADDQKREELKKSHTGLVVYNLTDAADKELFPGLAQWDGNRWVSLTSGALGAAVFEPLYCENISVEGEYWKDVDLTPENVITLLVNVIKPGYYNISASSKNESGDENGYSFSKKGVALECGWIEVVLDADAGGTPTEDGKDEIILTGVGMVCNKSIFVDTEKDVPLPASGPYAVYELSAIRVKGVYSKGKDLNNTNTIEIDVNVSSEGSYSISVLGYYDQSGTLVPNGIQYGSRSGTFSTTGSRTIIFQATAGKPEDMTPVELLIERAGNGLENYIVTVDIEPQEITYAVIGTNKDNDKLLSTYFWSRTPRHDALKLASNFGSDPNSIVKVNNFHMLWDAGPDTAAGYLEDGYLENGTRKQPDIILYNTYGLTNDGGLLKTRNYLTTALVKQLAEYVKKGGCLIFGASNDEAGTYSNRDDTNNLLEKIYEGITPVPYVAAEAKNKTGGLTRADNTFVIRNEPNDPIIKGPFYDLSGGDKYWGEDNQGNVVLPRDKRPNTVKQICSAHNEVDFAGEDPDDSIVWYDTHFNLFFFGDSAGSTQNPKYALGDIDFPALYVDGKPQSKLYGVGLSGIKKDKQIIYNAYLEMNAVAWAIDRAINHGGINFK